MDFVYFRVAITRQQKEVAARYWEAARKRVRAELLVDSDDERSAYTESDKLMRIDTLVQEETSGESVSTLRVFLGALRVIYAIVWALLLYVGRRRRVRSKKECEV